MNAAVMIGDNTRTAVSYEPVSSGRGSSQQVAESPQQRFEDVLPLAKAAQETPSDNAQTEEATEEATAEDEADNTQEATNADTRAGRPVRKRGDTAAGAESVGWQLTGILPAATQGRQKADAGDARHLKSRTQGLAAETAAPATRVGREGRLASSPHAKTLALPTPQQTQSTGPIRTQAKAPAGEQLADAPAEVDEVHGVGSGSSGRTERTGRQLFTLGGPAKKSLTPVANTRPVQVAESAPQGVTAGQTAVRNAGMQGLNGPRTDNPMAQTGGQGDSAARDSSSIAVPETAKGQAGQALAGVRSKADADGLETGKQEQQGPTPIPHTDAASKSQRNPQGTSPDGQQTDSPKHAVISASESPKRGPQAQNAAFGDPSAEPTGGAVHADAKPDAAGAASTALTAGESVGLGLSHQEAGVMRSGGASLTLHASNSMTSDVPIARGPVQSVGEQILDSLHASMTHGDRQVLVRLNPPELGTVLVRFQEQGEQIHGTLEVSNQDTRRQIEQALPQVVRSLQDAGVQVRRLDVVNTDQPERDLSRQQLPQDAWPQQQGWGQGRENLHAPPQTRWSQGTQGHPAGHEAPVEDETGAAVPRGRIDMLL